MASTMKWTIGVALTILLAVAEAVPLEDWTQKGLIRDVRAPKKSKSSCGGRVTGSRGTLTSPNFPSPYPTDVTCEWVIRVGPKQAIELTIETIDIEQSKKCRYDSLEINDGPNSKSPELGAFCGTKPPKAAIRSSGNSMYVKLTSDDGDTGKGFRATWRAVSRDIKCGGVFSNLTGTMTSPMFPSNYPANVDCEWIIKVPITHALTLIFEVFNIERSSKCKYDSVEIWEGDKKDSPSLGRFCGTDSPGKIKAQGTTLKVKLHSDESDTGHGFRAVWTSKRLTQPEDGSGEHNFNEDEGTEQDFYIEKYYIHPKYDEKTTDNDMALIKLDRPATLNKRVNTICLPEADDEFKPGTKCTISGWGALQEGAGSTSKVLMQAKVPLVSRDQCSHQQSYGDRITENMLCAGMRQGGVDSCQGDSGGPFVCTNPENPRQWTLVGVTSWGKGCARALKYGIYANVRRYLHWINLITGQLPTLPPRTTPGTDGNTPTLPSMPGGGGAPALPPLP
ncbi:tolloid-like protein 1 isoform X2 [Nematostella vectensis]|uniref:tolloid-like protein 1 isoform X2 n=1 Tax=Nematostella vectensis TaxID=45351 RepID=UPI0020778A4A|nr:tolloid-like protein 1 isoform X2 [Nematostella vectensis]